MFCLNCLRKNILNNLSSLQSKKAEGNLSVNIYMVGLRKKQRFSYLQLQVFIILYILNLNKYDTNKKMQIFIYYRSFVYITHFPAEDRPRPFLIRCIYSSADWFIHFIHFRLFLSRKTWLENHGTE